MTRQVVGVGLALVVASLSAAPARAPQTGPVVVFETVKGTIEFQLFPEDAPKSVEHIVALVRKNCYRGLRFHRVERSLAQVGDPMTRDMSRRAYWGSGGCDMPIGVAEFSKRRTHQRGTVGLAHSGSAELADSQIYFMKAASPSLDGKHVIIGQVTAGMSVVDKIEATDRIKTAFIKGEGPPF